MVALVGVLALATGWYAATAISPAAQAPQQSPSARGGPRPLGRAEAVAPLTEELHSRLRALPSSPSPGRNPFVFGGRMRASSSTASASATAVPAATTVVSVPQPPAPPRFQLSGIASSRQDGAIVLTAILTDYGTLVFAKAGDKLAGGYRVDRVEEAAAILVSDTGAELKLTLK